MKKIILTTSILLLTISSILSQTYDKKNNILTFPPRKQNIEQDILTGYPVIFDDEALEYYNKAVNSTYTNPDLAAEYYLEAIKIDPRFVQAYDNLGQLFRVLEKYDLAITCYKKSIEICPNGNIAHANLATLYRTQNKIEDAINEYKKVIDIKPNSAEGYYGVASIYLDQKKLDLALINGEKALAIYKKNPNSGIGDGYGLVGLIYYYLGNHSKAKTHIQLAKEKYSEYDLKEVFNDTFPLWMLKELSIE